MAFFVGVANNEDTCAGTGSPSVLRVEPNGTRSSSVHVQGAPHRGQPRDGDLDGGEATAATRAKPSRLSALPIAQATLARRALSVAASGRRRLLWGAERKTGTCPTSSPAYTSSSGAIAKYRSR